MKYMGLIGRSSPVDGGQKTRLLLHVLSTAKRYEQHCPLSLSLPWPLSESPLKHVYIPCCFLVVTLVFMYMEQYWWPSYWHASMLLCMCCIINISTSMINKCYQSMMVMSDGRLVRLSVYCLILRPSCTPGSVHALRLHTRRLVRSPEYNYIDTCHSK